MAESQNTEYKEVWKDDYLKWICGFANSQGGTLYIGVDDNGKVIGLTNEKKLLEDLPNKIASGLGIITEINSRRKNGLDYIEINVSKSIPPISYHGEFYVRSGATNQKLTGTALIDFISKKTGVHWEDGIAEGITVDDLDEESFKIFRKEALLQKRMSEADLNVSNRELLEKLNLVVGEKLKRTAVLLFHKNPSVIQMGSHVQVGLFSNADVLYHDMLEGSLISTAYKIVDLIYWKYLKAKISFQHDRRVETYPFARIAVREAIFNAIVHNCYMYGAPIQIRIQKDEMIISNTCILPEGWSLNTLTKSHTSIPYNPVMANVFYRAGFIEHWGRGIEKIFSACREIGAEPPEYELIGNILRLHLKALPSAIIEEDKILKNQTALIGNDGNDFGNDNRKIGNDGNDFGNDNHGIGNDGNDFGNDNHEIGNDGNDFGNEDIEERVISILRATPNISLEQIAQETKLSKRTISRLTKRLIDENKIKRIGNTRTGHWKVN